MEKVFLFPYIEKIYHVLFCVHYIHLNAIQYACLIFVGTSHHTCMVLIYLPSVVVLIVNDNCLQMFNGGLGGAPSSYMEVCSKLHIPAYTDIIVVEFTLNDEASPTPSMDNVPRRAFERLLRKLLSYPHRPAVIVLHVFRWFRLLGVSSKTPYLCTLMHMHTFECYM